MKNSFRNKIGIFIPTYNRARYLDKCLDSVTREVKEFGFPIYVSDDCSEDETEETLELYKQSFNNVTYSINKSNLGLYKNILKVIEKAQTEYIWLLGDDDAILPDRIEKIVSVIEQGYDYVVLNSVPYDVKLEKKRAEKIIQCIKDTEYTKGESNKLLVNLKKWSYHGYISSMIIKTKLLHELMPKYCEESFSIYGNIWFPLAMFYEAIRERSGIFICDPIVINRENPRAMGKDYWNFMYIDHIKAIEYLGDLGYDLQTLKKSLNFNTLSTIFVAVSSRIDNPLTKLYNDFVKSDYIMPLYTKITILAIDFMPVLIINILHRIIVKLKS